MKTKLLLSILMVSLAAIVLSQTYTEVHEGGWGQGMTFSRPVFTDFENNGLLDLIVGEASGNLNHYEQNEAGSTVFNLISDNFNEIKKGHALTSAFIDLDNDELMDMIIGEVGGSLYHYEQEAEGARSFILVTDSFNNIDVGRWATPCFTDLDNDTLLDLIIGEEDGNLNHYEQDFKNSTGFSLVSDSLCDIVVGEFSQPGFTDIDNDGLLDMLVGEYQGKIYHYEQDAPASTCFTLESDKFNDIDVGSQAVLTFADIDLDGLQDMVVGEYFGFLNHYEQVKADSSGFQIITENFIGTMDAGRNPALALADIDNDGLLDIIAGWESGYLIHYMQDAEGISSFTMVSDRFNDIFVGNNASPCFTDLDNDGLLDLIIGEEDGNLNHYEQEYTDSTIFVLQTDSLSGIDEDKLTRPKPCFADLDNDGLLDLIIGEYSGNIHHYEQVAVDSADFALISEEFSDINVGFTAAPVITDLENDGLLDLIVGEANNNLNHYKQDAPNSLDFILINEEFCGINPGYSTTPVFADLNNDALEDLLVGVEHGGIHYFQRNEELSVIKYNGNYADFTFSYVYPNPFKKSTVISYKVPFSNYVSLTVYNILGMKIRTLLDEYQKQGDYYIDFDAGNLPDGIYFFKLQFGNEWIESYKMMLRH